MAFENSVIWVSVVEIDGERHVIKTNGVADRNTTLRHVKMLHPQIKVISLEKADPNDPIGHIQRVSDHVRSLDASEPLTPEKFAQSQKLAAQLHNMGQPPLPAAPLHAGAQPTAQPQAAPQSTFAPPTPAK